jgi:streptogramin lyase
MGIGMTRHALLMTAAVACGVFAGAAEADVTVQGAVLDLNGRPVPQAQVTFEPGLGAAGPSAVTVFTGDDGVFAFPDVLANVRARGLELHARALGWAQQSAIVEESESRSDRLTATIVMRPSENQADVAPSSAWLASIEDPDAKAELIQLCITCHQIPAPEMRAYATAIAAVDLGDPETVRAQSWAMVVQHMGYLTMEMFGAGNPAASLTPGDDFSYGVADEEGALAILKAEFDGPMETLSGYDYGAPVIATADTVIREYEIPEPNAVREALLIDGDLWVADVNSSNMIRVDTATGAQRIVPVPSDRPVGPHSMHRGPDDTLWVTPLYNGQVSQLDPATEEWRTWRLEAEGGRLVGIHDLSFGYEHELITDDEGRIWYSDIGGTAVGYFKPETGEVATFPVPDVPGRPRQGSQVYGFAMESDHKTVWYSQLMIGAFGSFNTQTETFEQLVVLPSIDAGPRRITISDEDVLYVPLFGAGQLVEYDTRTDTMATYDLPDRAAAPYAVTWDDVRKVVWIPTSNADAIYRFDPATKEFGVIPLPRQRAYTRMITVDHDTGDLVTSYANIHERVRGPRMALTVHVGDDYGARRVAHAGGGR